MHLSWEHSIAQLPEPVPDLAKGRTQVTALLATTPREHAVTEEFVRISFPPLTRVQN